MLARHQVQHCQRQMVVPGCEFARLSPCSAAFGATALGTATGQFLRRAGSAAVLLPAATTGASSSATCIACHWQCHDIGVAVCIWSRNSHKGVCILSSVHLPLHDVDAPNSRRPTCVCHGSAATAVQRGVIGIWQPSAASAAAAAVRLRRRPGELTVSPAVLDGHDRLRVQTSGEEDLPLAAKVPSAPLVSDAVDAAQRQHMATPPFRQERASACVRATASHSVSNGAAPRIS